MRLDVDGVSKVYKDGTRAVDDVSMQVGTGVLGLLGPNGAGKSSLIRVIATVTRATSGTVRWDGTDVSARPDELRRVLGYLPQDFGVYPNLNAREFLSYLAATKGLSARASKPRIDELLQLVNLTDAAKRPLGGFSGGMRQRVGIAQALLGDPQLLVVDEPTVGLDPEERVEFRNLLGELATDRVVIMSTHIVPDLEAVASDVAVIAASRVRRRGTPGELTGRMRDRVWEVSVHPDQLPALRAEHTVGRVVRTAEGIRVRVLGDAPPVVGALPVEPGLEDAYLDAVHGSAMVVAR